MLTVRCQFVQGVLILLGLFGCVTDGTNEDARRGQAVVISTLDLFSQITPPRGGKPWLGDWEFRRDRLDLVDTALRDIRPEIAVFQNSMRRTGSTSESDAQILKAGSLARYQWQDSVLESIIESGEDRLLAVGVSSPIEFVGNTASTQKSYWQLGTDGHVTMSTLEEDGVPMLVANVLMPSRKDQVNLWYSFLQERILAYRKSQGICSSRVILAGYLPFEGDARKSQQLLDGLGLKDTAAGFCQNADRCHTATASNGIFALTRVDEGDGHVDKILVPLSASVITGGLAFTASRELDRYKESYLLTRLWASQRYGWFAKVRFAPCDDLE